MIVVVVVMHWIAAAVIIHSSFLSYTLKLSAHSLAESALLLTI